MTGSFSSLGFQLTCPILKGVFPTVLFNWSTQFFYNHVIIIHIIMKVIYDKENHLYQCFQSLIVEKYRKV